MAISPPSDIVLDVARAVEPANLEAARTQLAKRAGGAALPGPAGTFSLEEATGTAGAGATRAPTVDGDAKSYKRFEAMVLQTFIQNMLPKDTESVYGKGMAGDMWKSLMAGKLADVMSDRGGIGIADRLLADHYRDGDKTTSIGPISRGPERAEIDQQSMLSNALVQEMQRKVTNAITDEPGSKPAQNRI